MSQTTPPELTAFPPAKQQRLDQLLLLATSADGAITPAEKAELESLVAQAEELMIANARLLADFARTHSPQPPVAAVPVTVWVTPQLAER